MKDCDKTKEQLILELTQLRQQLDLLKQANRQTTAIKDAPYFKYDVQKILDSLPFYVLLVNENHNILLANKAVKDALNIDPESIIGNYCPRIIHGSDTPIPECPLEEAVLIDRAVEREFFDKSSNTWLRSAIYPSECRDLDGNIVYFHMVQDITQIKNSELQLKETVNKLYQVSKSITNAITNTVEKRDPYTAGHQQRVSRLAVEIAKEMSISDEQIQGIRVAGLVHDIGKVAIPIEILSKPGKISIHELNIIKDHPQIGYEILREIEFSWPIAKIILQHHERINGTGYPNCLRGEEILLEAKIIAVADVVEAMSSHRPYRQAFNIEAALNHIKYEKGNLYDPEVVDACIRYFSNGGSCI